YDAAVTDFIADILDERRSQVFLDDFAVFRRRVAHYGLFNSLSQTLLKITLPGVADTYQGTELWDFSLVDPDNRRPVDYDLRMRLLSELKTTLARDPDWRPLTQELVRTKEDGRVKLFVHYQALHCRRANPGLFNLGEYFPIGVAGQASNHLFGFLRRHEGRW